MNPEINPTRGLESVPAGPRPEGERRLQESESSNTPPKRGKASLERAHKTVDGIAEAAPGSPRSGSA